MNNSATHSLRIATPERASIVLNTINSSAKKTLSFTEEKVTRKIAELLERQDAEHAGQPLELEVYDKHQKRNHQVRLYSAGEYFEYAEMMKLPLRALLDAINQKESVK